jgi:signal transduction histidine kinase
LCPNLKDKEKELNTQISFITKDLISIYADTIFSLSKKIKLDKMKKEIDKAVTELKTEMNNNFNGKNFQRISETANNILHRSEEINYLKGKYQSLSILGSACFNICDYEKAQKYYLRSISIAEQMKDNKKIAWGLNNIGIIFFTLEDYKKALIYYEKALELKLNTKYNGSIATTLSNIGLAYNMINQPDKALEYFKKSLDLNEESNNKPALCRELNNIGLAWQKKGEHVKALDFFDRSYKISIKEKNKKRTATALIYIANQHLKQNDSEIALKKAIEGEKLSITLHSNMHLLHFYDVIHKVYKISSQCDKAYEYLEKFMTLKEIVYKEDLQNKIFDMQIKYESEKKEKEAELFRTKNAELSEINSAKDKFFKIIHHDLLNPFTAISSTSEFLYKYYDKLDESKKRNHIKKIHSSSEKLLKLIDNLFSWVKAQSGEIEFKPEVIDLQDIVENNLQLLANNIIAKEIETESKYSKNRLVYADSNMTDTVIRNIIANAIKFTHHEGKIDISVRKHRGMIHLKIEDNGVGIKKSRLARLFKISESVSTPGTDNEKGTGLGLILVKEFMDLNKGIIDVKSTPGKGTVFTLKFITA